MKMETIIRCGNTEAKIDSLGGELISCRVKGTEYIWNGDPTYWASHAPVLFPVVGALVDNKIRIGGKEYTIGKHGFARKTEFAYVESGADYAVYALRESEETLAQYPFCFELKVTHRVLEDGFVTTYEVVNTDEKPIWFCIGGHAGFRCPLHEGERFEDYELRFEKPETLKAGYTDANSITHPEYEMDGVKDGIMKLSYPDYDVDVLILDGIESRKVQLINRNTGHGLWFDYTGYEALGVWTPPKKEAPFLCLESWKGVPAIQGETGDFEDKPYAVCLEPSKSYSVSYSMHTL